MNIPFIDLKAQYRLLEGDIRSRMDAVLEHGQYILGPEVKELETRLAEFSGVNHAIACSSGTDALLMALMAHDVGPGDAIFTTPFTFIATAEVIALTGATPVFVDIDPVTFNIDPAALKLAIKALQIGDAGRHPLPKGAENLKPRGVIPVDLFGIPADYDAISDIADKHGLFVLQDACQSYGGVYKGKRTGAQGDVAATSFFPAKPLGCYGDGGAVFTNDESLAEMMHSIKVHGMGSHRYKNERIGINARLDTLQAAVLLAKMSVFPDEIVKRGEVAARYNEMLAGTSLVTPTVPEGSVSAWAQYSLLADDRDAMKAALAEAGIPSAVYYPKPLHVQDAFGHLGYKAGDMPVSEDCAARIFSLPMHPYLEASVQEQICEVLKKAL